MRIVVVSVQVNSFVLSTVFLFHPFPSLSLSRNKRRATNDKDEGMKDEI